MACSVVENCFWIFVAEERKYHESSSVPTYVVTFD